MLAVVTVAVVPHIECATLYISRSLLEDRHLAAARKVVEQLRPADEEVPRVVEAMSNRCRWLGEGAPAPGQRSQVRARRVGVRVGVGAGVGVRVGVCVGGWRMLVSMRRGGDSRMTPRISLNSLAKAVRRQLLQEKRSTHCLSLPASCPICARASSSACVQQVRQRGAEAWRLCGAAHRLRRLGRQRGGAGEDATMPVLLPMPVLRQDTQSQHAASKHLLPQRHIS